MDHSVDLGSGRVTVDAEARARAIRLLVFDVDGVLTDGTLWYMPVGKDSAEHIEIKGFSAHDGIGMALARRAGLQIAFITKRRSQSLALRARDLRIEHVVQGVDHKLAALQKLWAEMGLTQAQTAVMGDDLVDLPMLEGAGLAATPADARPEVKAQAHYVAPHGGGRGAARDLIDFILQAQGCWQETVKGYLAGPDSDYAEEKS